MTGARGPKVAVNMLWCVPGVGGSQEYLVRQLLGLAEADSDVELEVFAPRGFAARQPRLAAAVPIVEAPSTCTRRWLRILIEHTWLAWRTRRHDIVHHGGGTLPRIGGRTTVLTVHDVQWTDHPDFVAPVKLRYLRSVVPSSLRRATRIAVPTTFVARTLVQHFATAPEKISVVRHGVEADLVNNATPEAELRRRWSLGDGPVLAYPAITHPHKNHRFVLSLMSRADSPWGDPDLRVVFAGSPGTEDAAVRATIERLGLGGRVVMPGRINDADRNGLLAMSEAMVFPSVYEGFGAPLIEAMHMGTPVCASDQAAIVEVVGDGGVVSPLDPQSWDAALETVRRDRAAIIERGARRALVFTMAASGADLASVYATVYATANGTVNGSVHESPGGTSHGGDR